MILVYLYKSIYDQNPNLVLEDQNINQSPKHSSFVASLNFNRLFCGEVKRRTIETCDREKARNHDQFDRPLISRFLAEV